MLKPVNIIDNENTLGFGIERGHLSFHDYIRLHDSFTPNYMYFNILN